MPNSPPSHSGRGAFGFVYESALKHHRTQQSPRRPPPPPLSPASSASPDDGSGPNSPPRNVAVKMLQPIDPGANARESTLAAYRAGKSKWERDPLQYACKAYCTARQELNILIHLRHPHIVPLVGICTNPLSIVLELAPAGALDTRLRHYRRSGDKLKAKVVQLVILQIGR